MVCQGCELSKPHGTLTDPHRAKPLDCFHFCQCAYIVLRGAAEAARLALDALPLVRPHRLHHVVSELQTRGVTCGGTARRKVKKGEKFTMQSQLCFTEKQTKTWTNFRELICTMCCSIWLRLWGAAVMQMNEFIITGISSVFRFH